MVNVVVETKVVPAAITQRPSGSTLLVSATAAGMGRSILKDRSAPTSVAAALARHEAAEE